MTKQRLLLVRHGLTAWNIEHRFQGQSNLPLEPEGLRQAEALGARLADERIDAVFTSNLDRALQTAREIAQYHTCELIQDSCLREMDFGDWEGHTYEEIRSSDYKSLEIWEADILNAAPPNGESLQHFADRVGEVLEKFKINRRGQDILIATHGGVIQVLLTLILGLPPDAYWQFSLEPASLSEVYLHPGGGKLSLLNDTCHVKEMD